MVADVFWGVFWWLLRCSGEQVVAEVFRGVSDGCWGVPGGC